MSPGKKILAGFVAFFVVLIIQLVTNADDAPVPLPLITWQCGHISTHMCDVSGGVDLSRTVRVGFYADTSMYAAATLRIGSPVGPRSTIGISRTYGVTVQIVQAADAKHPGKCTITVLSADYVGLLKATTCAS